MACQRTKPSWDNKEEGLRYIILSAEGMTMCWRRWATGAVAVAALLFYTGSSRAGDTMRLDLKAPLNASGFSGSADTTTLELNDDNDADTIQVGRGGGFRGGVGFRGVGFRGVGFRGVGFRGVGFRGVGFRTVGFRTVGFRTVGFRTVGFRTVAFRGGWGWRGWGWPGWGWGWRGWGWPGWGWGSPVVISSFPTTISSPPVIFYIPVGGAGDVMPYSTMLRGNGYGPGEQPGREELMPPATQEGGSTYPYDGGPDNPVPMPKRTAPAPQKVAPGGKVVSLPPKREKLAYPAYGEQSGRGTFAVDRPPLPVRADLVRRDQQH
jgi:hypothetical protein